jgi:hypothetical protein
MGRVDTGWRRMVMEWVDIVGSLPSIIGHWGVMPISYLPTIPVEILKPMLIPGQPFPVPVPVPQQVNPMTLLLLTHLLSRGNLGDVPCPNNSLLDGLLKAVSWEEIGSMCLTPTIS